MIPTESMTQRASIDTMRCPSCRGCGTVALVPSLQVTLDLLRARGPMTAPDVLRELEETCGVTAINNRLVELEQLGFAERIGKNVRAWLWTATKRRARLAGER